VDHAVVSLREVLVTVLAWLADVLLPLREWRKRRRWKHEKDAAARGQVWVSRRVIMLQLSAGLSDRDSASRVTDR
jgi:hypothetical protein